MKNRIARFLAGGCIVNTVLITAAYSLRELFFSNIPGRELSFRTIGSILLISFVLSAADLLIEKKTASRIIINYVVTLAGVLLAFRIIRGKYDGGMQIAAVCAVYTVVYGVMIAARLLIYYLSNRKNNVDYQSQFK